MFANQNSDPDIETNGSKSANVALNQSYPFLSHNLNLPFSTIPVFEIHPATVY